MRTNEIEDGRDIGGMTAGLPVRTVTGRFLIAVMVIMLAGCGDSESARSGKMMAAVRHYVEALSGGDVNALLGTMHPNSEELVGAKQAVARLAEIGVTFELEQARVTENSTDEAMVRFVLRAQGPEPFRNCRLTELGVLRRDEGRWKVFATEVQEVEYLDGEKGRRD